MEFRYLIVSLFAVIAKVNGFTSRLEIDVVLTPIKFASAQNVVVTVRYRNTGNDTIFLSSWRLPKQTLHDPLFEVTCNGVPVAYLGPLMKRRSPTPADGTPLAPGQQISTIVQVSPAYDMTQSGNYTIKMKLAFNKLLISVDRKPLDEIEPFSGVRTSLFQATTATCFVEGRKNELNGQKKAATIGQIQAVVTYTECSSIQISKITAANNAAKQYSNEVVSYLTGQNASATPRYTTWFGTFSTTN